MLQSYSWSAFFLAMGGLSCLWYAGVALTAYRKECLSFFKLSRGKPVDSPPARSGAVLVGQPAAGKKSDHPAIMGKSRSPSGLESSSLSELSFTAGNNEAVGLKSDVLAELKEIFTLLAENDGEKGDFIGLIEAMKLRYPPIASHPARAQINSFIQDHAPFLLSIEELENLWD